MTSLKTRPDKAVSRKEREKRERETKVKNAAIKPKSKTETDAVTIEKPRDATKCQ